MKKCKDCGAEKELAGFYKHRMMKDGHLNKCIECVKAREKRYRAKHIEAVRAYDRRRASSPKRRELAKIIGERWRARHADRRAAQVILGNAVRSGRIKPWPVCAMPDCDKKPEAHHPDYGSPLDVVWLCSAHHKQAHYG